MHVWNNMSVSKWRQIFTFGVTYPFKDRETETLNYFDVYWEFVVSDLVLESKNSS